MIPGLAPGSQSRIYGSLDRNPQVLIQIRQATSFLLSEESMSHTPAQKEKQSAALSSVLAAVVLTGFKVVVGVLTKSLGILAEAAHSALDLVAALMTFFAVSIADRPADKEHHFGHA